MGYLYSSGQEEEDSIFDFGITKLKFKNYIV